MPSSSDPAKVKASAIRFYPEAPPADERAVREVLALWEIHRRFLILAGPPGVGKTRTAEDTIQELLKKKSTPFGAADCRLTSLFPNFRTLTYSDTDIREKLVTSNISFVWDLCVMHPQITYEDIIRGYRMVESTTMAKIEVREGLLGFAARVASILESIGSSDALPSALLILDEINRAPLGQILGEAIYALDRRGESVATPYPLSGAGSLLTIPKNLLLLGTMNSVDRAISGFDFALRRRFATVYLTSSKSPIEKRFRLFKPTTNDLVLQLFDSIQHLVRNAKKTGVVPTSELAIGHSYFLPPASIESDEAAVDFLAKSLLYQMIPTLVDYQEQGLVEYQTSDLSAFLLGDLIDGRTALSMVSYGEIRDRLVASVKGPL